MVFYKVLGPNGKPRDGSSTRWHLPGRWKRGRWMPVIENIEPGLQGYHLVTRDRLSDCPGQEMWVAEGRGKWAAYHGDMVFAQARLVSRVHEWNTRTMMRFACDCIEHSLHVYERQNPGDNRPRHAIEVVRRFTCGQADSCDLKAVCIANYNTDRQTAWSITIDAANHALNESDAWYAPTDMAWAAAWGSLTADEWHDAWYSERKWQGKRLLEYIDGYRK